MKDDFEGPLETNYIDQPTTVGLQVSYNRKIYLIIPKFHECLGLVSWCRGEEFSVLCRVRNVDKQPSSQPELRNHHGGSEQKVGFTVVSGPDNVKNRACDDAGTSNKDEVSHVTGEDSPQDDDESQKSKVDSAEDWSMGKNQKNKKVRKRTYKSLKLINKD